MIYLVGVNHGVQFQNKTSDMNIINAFENYLTDACTCYKIDCIAEEMSVEFDISLNSASDFVPLRPPVSLIAAGGAVGAKRRWSFFHNLRADSVASLFLFLGFSDRLSFQFNLVAVVQ